MNTEKEDRRVKYTKMALKKSLINLLSKKDISSITIKQICEDADINRATFYTHYKTSLIFYVRLKMSFWRMLKYTYQNSKREKLIPL